MKRLMEKNSLLDKKNKLIDDIYYRLCQQYINQNHNVTLVIVKKSEPNTTALHNGRN